MTFQSYIEQVVLFTDLQGSLIVMFYIIWAFLLRLDAVEGKLFTLLV